MEAEGFKRLTWEIEPGRAASATLTVTHELDRAPKTAAQVSGEITEAGGGWSFILSDLKTLLETSVAGPCSETIVRWRPGTTGSPHYYQT